MDEIKTYFAAAFRGKKGDKATLKEINKNRERAIRLGHYYQKEFPELDIYIPHEKEDVALELWLRGKITTPDILGVLCDKARAARLLIMLAPFSTGMYIEREAALSCPPKTICTIQDFDIENIASVNHAIKEIISTEMLSLSVS